MGEATSFDSDGFRLFGMIDRGALPASGAGVVFCHPLGEERQHIDRVYVRFARQLAAAGFSTLRFDCRGHGDSSGELGDESLETMIADTRAAIDHLRRMTDVREIVLLGLRLGATVAALTAARAPDPMAVVLWSPIVEGRAYVRELLRKKLASQLAYQEEGGSRETLVTALRKDGRLEFEGGHLSLAMYEQLAAVDLVRDVPGCSGAALLSGIRLRRRAAALGPLADAYRAAGTPCDVRPAEEREYWDVRSMFDGIFPDELYRETVAWLQGRGHAGN